jgi:hypothetical protein
MDLYEEQLNQTLEFNEIVKIDANHLSSTHTMIKFNWCDFNQTCNFQ